MKHALAALLSLFLLLSALGAAAETPSVLGQPFPDFTITDTEGNEITLSSLLEEKELVVLSVFATWCPPCKKEFPWMESTWQSLSDKMAVVALSADSGDTMEKLARYKADNALSFSVGQTGDTGIPQYLQLMYYPTNVFIDRYGNAALICNTFADEAQFRRAVNLFLGGDYTQTVSYSSVPEMEVDVPYPDEAALSAALNAEGGVLSFSSDPDKQYFPFLPEERDGRSAAFASNPVDSRSISMLRLTLTAQEGDALAFEVARSLADATAVVEIDIDDLPAKFFIGRSGWTPWCLPLEAGEHDVRFCLVRLASGSADDFCGFDNIRLLSGEEAAAALDALPGRPAADDYGLSILNEGRRTATLLAPDALKGLPVHVLQDETVRLGITLPPQADADLAVLCNEVTGEITPVSEFTAEEDRYVAVFPAAGAKTPYGFFTLYDSPFGGSPLLNCLTVRDEDGIRALCADLGQPSGVSWTYDEGNGEP
ncbi:MAG: TlpA family protein disulfide reductase [Clostridia bacterium]|nr:TlpA family protein disulfide reductase [Clostridia bacterium]